jgi:hypothetical protein
MAADVATNEFLVVALLDVRRRELAAKKCALRIRPSFDQKDWSASVLGN